MTNPKNVRIGGCTLMNASVAAKIGMGMAIYINHTDYTDHTSVLLKADS